MSNRHRTSIYMNSDELLKSSDFRIMTDVFTTSLHKLANLGYKLKYTVNNLSVTNNRVLKLYRYSEDITFFLKWKDKNIFPSIEDVKKLLDSFVEDKSVYFSTSEIIKMKKFNNTVENSPKEILSMLLTTLSEADIISHLNDIRLEKLNGWRPIKENIDFDIKEDEDINIPELQYVKTGELENDKEIHLYESKRRRIY